MACQLLGKIDPNIRFSPIYQSESIGFDGPSFYNLVCAFDFAGNHQDLLKQLNRIELKQDKGGSSFQNRTIDLDLLMLGDIVIHEDGLELPRSDILKYPFVLKPLAELAPETKHPLLQITFHELWQHFKKDYVDIEQVSLANFSEPAFIIENQD